MRNPMRRLALILLFFFAANLCYAQQWSGILAGSRAIDWTRAGVVGGIPSGSWTQCGATIAAGASSATVQAAINGCAANHYVQLGAGTFNIYVTMKSNVVLRGMGANQTNLVPTGGGVGCYSGTAVICMGTDGTFDQSTTVLPGGSQSATWTAGYAQGATSITLTNVGSSGITNGQYIFLDQANVTSPATGLFICDTTSCSTEGGSPGRTISGVEHSQMQAVKVTAGCATACTGAGPFTLTITPLYGANWSGTFSPGAWWTTLVQNAGVENLSIDATNSGAEETIGMFNVANSWVSGITSIKAPRASIWIIQGAHNTVQNSYFYQTISQGIQGYGVEEDLTSDNLVVNNIMQQIDAPFIGGSQFGNTFVYNYQINDFQTQSASCMYLNNVAHDAGSEYNLYEGNFSDGIEGDDVHGSSGLNTLFRNISPGWELGKSCTTVAVYFDPYNRYENVVGNVLGTPGKTVTYRNDPGATFSVYVDNLAHSPIAADPQVAATLLRWANYDNVTGATRFCGNSSDTGWATTCASTSEVPTGATPYANAVPTLGDTVAGQQPMPASFAYTAKPSWWPSTKAWPPIGPDVTNGNIGQCVGGTYGSVFATLAGQCTGGSFTAHVNGGRAYSIPAMDCYFSLGGPPDGSGNVLSFNANTCYVVPTGPSNATPIICPNNSQVGNNANCVQPPLLTFGKQGTSTASMAIPASISNCQTVNNPECNGTGNLTLAATVFTLSGTNAADFAVGAGGCTANLVIAPGGSCSFTVTFTPSATAGTNEVATLTIAFAGGISSSVLALTGTSATVTTLGAITSPLALTAGVNYQLTQNVSCATTCFTVAASSSSFTDLNLNGFTVTWCTGTSTNQEGGVIARGNNWYTTVHNGSILQGAGSCTGVISGGWGSGAIIGTGSNGMSGTNAFNLTLAWSASQGRGVADNYAGTIIPTVQGTVIHDVTYTDNDPGNCNAVGCRSQDQFYSFTVIQAAQRTAVPVDQFYNVTGTGGPQGTFSTNSSGAICSNNLINLGTSVANGTVANGYVCQDWGNAMIVANNLLLGTGSQGGIISGRGIQLANVSGQAIQQAMIQGNVGVVNILDNDAEYPCATVEYGATYGIQIKVFNSGTVNNNTIQNNNLITTAGPCGGYGFSTTNDVSAPTTGSVGNVLRNNQWVCKGNAGFTWTNTVNCAGMRIDYAVGNSTPMFQDYSDYFQGDSSDLYVYFDGSDPWNCFQCTLNKPATAVTGWVFIDFTHGNCCASTSFKPGPFTFTDPVFQGGATESNTNLSAWATSNPSQSFAYIIQFTQKVFCLGATNGKYIQGCTVQYTGPHSTHTCTTDSTGSCSVAVIENKYAATIGVYSVTNYNNYTLAVSNAGCTTNTQTSLAITSTNTSTVTLSGCPGTILTGTPTTLFGFNQTLFGTGHENSGLTYGWQRSWDSPCVWALIESVAGTYNFAAQCAAFIQSAVNHGAGVQFTMGRTPAVRVTGTCTGSYGVGCAQLASDIDGVNAITPAFLTALANYMSGTWPNVRWRVEGRNESDLAGECAENSAIGGHCSMAHLVKEQETIFNTIKAINPAIQVLCPPASTMNHFGVHLYNGADTAIPPFPGSGFAAAEGLNYCDAMTVHPYFFLNGQTPPATDAGSGTTCGTTGSSYACQPEEAVNNGSGGCTGGALGQINCVLIANGKAGMAVESSETDWGTSPPNLLPANGGMTDTQKRQWIGRYIVYAWNAGQTNITWYTWECPSGNLATCPGTLSGSGVSPAGANALGVMQDWLIGSTYTASPCTVVSGTTYECALSVNTASGKIGPAHIVFDNAGNTPTISAFGANTAYRLDGSSSPVVGNLYTVDGEPTLLFTASAPPPTLNTPAVLFSGTVPLSGVFQGGVF